MNPSMKNRSPKSSKSSKSSKSFKSPKSSATPPLEPAEPLASSPLENNSEVIESTVSMEGAASTESIESTASAPNTESIESTASIESASNTESIESIASIESPTTADIDLVKPPDLDRQQPIPPPSEPKQYRAIGLVRGQYMPSADQFTRGTLLASDETLIDAVLLGRVMSLVKNHLDLSQPHLWVVYPRTRQEDGNLHVQIVGVWEPEQLSKVSAQTTDSDLEESGITNPTDAALPQISSEVKDDYFSIRGEVIYQSREQPEIIVKIKQAPRKDEDKPKFFKLKLDGNLGDKAVGHFWDLQVQRQKNSLVIQEATDIGILPAKKKPPFRGGGSRPPARKPFGSQYPSRPSGDRLTPIAPPKRREPVPKPIKRKTGE